MILVDIAIFAKHEPRLQHPSLLTGLRQPLVKPNGLKFFQTGQRIPRVGFSDYLHQTIEPQSLPLKYFL